MDNILKMLHTILKMLRHFKNSEISFWEAMAYLKMIQALPSKKSRHNNKSLATQCNCLCMVKSQIYNAVSD